MLARIAVRSALRIPRTSLTPAVARMYSENQFNKKEKAHEDQFARRREQAQLEKMKQELDEKKRELDEKKRELEDLQREHEELQQKHGAETANDAPSRS